MSERYITDRFLPDKAIDLIDEACSDVNLKTPPSPGAWRSGGSGTTMNWSATGSGGEGGEDRGGVARMAGLKSREMQLSGRSWTRSSAKGAPQLTIENLARVIELWTKIPATRIREAEFERLASWRTG